MAEDTSEPKKESTPEEESVENALQEEADDEAESSEAADGSGAAEGEPKKKMRSKKTKVVRRRKSKKEKERPLTGAVRLAVESGKVEFGSRTASAKAKLFVVAGNAQPEVKNHVLSMAKASDIPVLDSKALPWSLAPCAASPSRSRCSRFTMKARPT
jgi:ribosomal protein L30E